jgi:hypothetical protein
MFATNEDKELAHSCQQQAFAVIMGILRNHGMNKAYYFVPI